MTQAQEASNTTAIRVRKRLNFIRPFTGFTLFPTVPVGVGCDLQTDTHYYPIRMGRGYQRTLCFSSKIGLLRSINPNLLVRPVVTHWPARGQYGDAVAYSPSYAKKILALMVTRQFIQLILGVLISSRAYLC